MKTYLKKVTSTNFVRKYAMDENNSIGSIDALNNGFHLAFTAAAIVAGIAGIVAFVAIKKPSMSGGKEKKEVTVAAPIG
jgi:hypothetical protein